MCSTVIIFVMDASLVFLFVIDFKRVKIDLEFDKTSNLLDGLLQYAPKEIELTVTGLLTSRGESALTDPLPPKTDSAPLGL